MSPRRVFIGNFVFFVAWAALGILALAKADYLFGGIYLAFSVAWLLIGLRNRRAAKAEKP